eukprot:8376370-Ditylum_brightwellii.AAC.1
MVSEQRLELGKWWVLWVVLYMKKQGCCVIVLDLLWLCCPVDVRGGFINRFLEDRKQVCVLIASCNEVSEVFSQFDVAVFLCGAEAVYIRSIFLWTRPSRTPGGCAKTGGNV